jgi:hypothetical protein
MYGAFSLNTSAFDSSNDGQSIILEKEQGITEDPRGVYLAGDAVRILWDIGIREQMAVIGHRESWIPGLPPASVHLIIFLLHIAVDKVNFHKGTFKAPPFFTLDTGHGWLNQTLPDGIVQIQPKLGMFCSCRV